jgi:hypothetical protein
MEGTHEGAGNLYRQAFDMPWGNPHALARMEEKLRSIRGSVMEALGRMLADAGIEL